MRRFPPGPDDWILNYYFYLFQRIGILLNVKSNSMGSSTKFFFVTKKLSQRVTLNSSTDNENRYSYNPRIL